MKKIIGMILLLSLAFLTIAPFLFLITGTFMGTQEIKRMTAPVLGDAAGFVTWHLIPAYPTLRNIVALLLDSPEFFQMFWNTMKITGGILAGQAVFGIPGAWGLARYSFSGKKQIYLLYIILMMMPFQVTMLSEYLVLNTLNMMDTLRAVIMPGIFSTFSIFIMYRFFCGIPEALLEAARVDGAGELQIFFRIGIPVGGGGIISAAVLQFLECFSMIEQPLTFLKTKGLWPLSLYLPEIDLSQIGTALCASLVALLPSVFVFLAGQDYLEQGIVSAALKE